MKEVKTEVLIKASPAIIWKYLGDFEHYSEWNPFIYSIHGNVFVGNKIKIKLTPPNAKPMIFKPKVLKLIPNQELRWLGHFLVPGIFDGEHIFELIDNKNETTTFVQRERFYGVLVPFLKKFLDTTTKQGFELMNEKLKKKCE
jgi:hypothetical protein